VLGPFTWEIATHLVEALAWPVVGLLALVTIRPWRLVERVLRHGGTVSALGVEVAIAAAEQAERAATSAKQLESSELHGKAQEIAVPKAESAYDLIRQSYDELTIALSDALDRAGLEFPDWRNPRQAVQTLYSKNKISRVLNAALNDFFDAWYGFRRASDKAALPRVVAEEFYRTNVRLGRALAKIQ
jgi:hypothetical protein